MKRHQKLPGRCIPGNFLFFTALNKVGVSFGRRYDDKHLISTYDAKRAEKEKLESNLKYHIEFFRNGLNAIIKLWLAGGCRESPEEMADVLKQEYRGR